jgi:hypothetical protein
MIQCPGREEAQVNPTPRPEFVSQFRQLVKV